MPTPQARRLRREASNRALFREVNEGIREADLLLRDDEDSAMEVLCECGGLECIEIIPLAPDDYIRTRNSDQRFIVIPGHENLMLERVTERHDGWLMVEALQPIQKISD
jgi:hypothetical protein